MIRRLALKREEESRDEELLFSEQKLNDFRPGLDRDESSPKLDVIFIRGLPFCQWVTCAVTHIGRKHHCKGVRPAGGRGEIHNLPMNQVPVFI